MIEHLSRQDWFLLAIILGVLTGVWMLYKMYAAIVDQTKWMKSNNDGDEYN